MLIRFGLGFILSLSMVLGCTKSDPLVPAASPVKEDGLSEPLAQPGNDATQSTATAPTKSEQPPLSQTAEQSETKLDIDDEQAQAEAKLRAKLALQPNDAESLLALASLQQQQAEMTESGDLDYGKLKQSADLVRRALQANAALADTDEVRSFVAAVFFNEANALSLEKQDALALKSLRSAIDYGWDDLTELQNAVDLAHIRQNPEFKTVIKIARDKRKKKLQATVSALFIGKPDYKFDFNLDDTAGQPVAKQDFVGKLLIVNIWGTWCPPCRRELPDLIAASKKYRSQGVEFIGLNTEPENAVTAVNSIKASQKSFGINYPCALGNDDVFQQIPDFSAVPMTLFFNREGELQAQWVGQVDEIVLEMIIERLLADSPAETKK